MEILVLLETKLDSTFTSAQFMIDGFSAPYRLDRDKNGGGIIVLIREDIPSRLLQEHMLPEDIEALPIEINLRKTKLLLFGGYRSAHEVHGVSKRDFCCPRQDDTIKAANNNSNYRDHKNKSQ